MSPITLCAVVLRGGRACVWCRVPLLTVEDKTIDHYVPVAHGGAKGTPDNALPACALCNSSRGDARESWPAVMAARGLDYSAALARAHGQLATPIDAYRQEARAMAWTWYPDYMRRRAERGTERRRRHRAAARAADAERTAIQNQEAPDIGAISFGVEDL